MRVIPLKIDIAIPSSPEAIALMAARELGQGQSDVFKFVRHAWQLARLQAAAWGAQKVAEQEKLARSGAGAEGKLKIRIVLNRMEKWARQAEGVIEAMMLRTHGVTETSERTGEHIREILSTEAAAGDVAVARKDLSISDAVAVSDSTAAVEQAILQQISQTNQAQLMHQSLQAGRAQSLLGNRGTAMQKQLRAMKKFGMFGKLLKFIQPVLSLATQIGAAVVTGGATFTPGLLTLVKGLAETAANLVSLGLSLVTVVPQEKKIAHSLASQDGDTWSLQQIAENAPRLQKSLQEDQILQRQTLQSLRSV